VGGVRDPRGMRFDLQVVTSRRNERWANQPSRSHHDKRFRATSGTHALMGHARSAAKADLRYLGVLAPDNAAR
jgi:hypothetical protein